MNRPRIVPLLVVAAAALVLGACTACPRAKSGTAAAPAACPTGACTATR